jgi:hypothetical protein
VLAIFALSSAPASAHSTIVEQGDDYAVTDSNHKSGSVCDWEKDGHAVMAEWFDSDGNKVAIEEDGGDSGCDNVTFKGTADSVRVCEYADYDSWCTGFHKV